MLSKRNPQLNKHGELVHLLSIEGLPQAIIHQILDTAGTFLSVNDREVKKVPLLRGKSVFNLFFENSHAHPHHLRDCGQAPVRRRRSTSMVNVRSSAAKGESLLDTIDNLSRDGMPTSSWSATASSGAPLSDCPACARPNMSMSSMPAMAGTRILPRALLDMYTIRHFKKDFTKSDAWPSWATSCTRGWPVPTSMR